MNLVSWLLRPAGWVFYLVVVLEILFMISPFALHFYSAYGPTLNLLHASPKTAWLTQFYLPHFSETTSPLLNGLRPLAEVLILGGLVLFGVAAVPLYLSKLRRRGEVTGGLYRLVRHPQYLALAVLGLGTSLLWPRFLVLLTFVSMLFLYYLLARYEEQRCLSRYGEGYRRYVESTGMFLPRSLERALATLVPKARAARVGLFVGLWAVTLWASVAAGDVLRSWSLTKVSSSYSQDEAVLSPVVMEREKLESVYRAATEDPRVQRELGEAGRGKLLVYVVPEAWKLPDLPMEEWDGHRGHWTPADYDRDRYKVLFTRPRTHEPEASGRAIVETAWGRETLVLALVDRTTVSVTSVRTPPAHVLWGDIPTPLF